jgi:hypothetical protein
MRQPEITTDELIQIARARFPHRPADPGSGGARNAYNTGRGRS